MKRPAARLTLRFSTQTLLLQLAVVALVVLLSSTVHAWLTYDRLGGEAVTTRNTGTLGPSAGAKVPVFAPGSTAVVGEVSVGYSTETIGQSLARDIVPIALTAAGALLAGVLASFLLRRRLQRLTL